MLSACGGPAPEEGARQNGNAVAAAPAGPIAKPEPVQPAAPGTPSGLPDDRTPVSEAPFAETSAQGAANVVQTYYALIEAGKYAGAWKLWSDGGRASGVDPNDFAAAFGKYLEYHAQIGAPGDIEGAAGSLYVTVPIQAYGRRADGTAFREAGTVTLRRVNDVPASSAEQRKWHISAVTVGLGAAR